MRYHSGRRHSGGARLRRRLWGTATVAALAAAMVTGGPASASDPPVPDFDDHPPCVADIIAISCSVTGSATGGGEIVSWEWRYPGVFGNRASGQTTLLRFASQGVYEVTLTVEDDRGGTGTITKPTTVAVGG